MSNLLKHTETIKTMHLIALFLVVYFLISHSYQMFQLNTQLTKGLITSEIYERLMTSLRSDLKEFVGYVIIYFFGKEQLNNYIKKKSESDNA